MNKWKFSLFLVVVLALASSATWAQKVPKSTILNSEHDLRQPFSGRSYTLCSFCHIAHKTGTAPVGPGALLWNHTLSSYSNYGVYSSPSFDALGTDIAGVGGLNPNSTTFTGSNLCLSCHDGTVGVNSFYGGVGGVDETTPIYVGAAETIRDLTKTHPVNFTYDATLANAAGMRVPASTSSVDGGGLVPLENGKMQCTTCHDPHNGNSGIFSRPYPAQAVNTGTSCTYCHL